MLVLAGVIPAVRISRREKQRLSATEAYLALCRFATEQVAGFGASAPEILARAGERCRACGTDASDVGALLTAAESILSPEGFEAVKNVFGSGAGTREEQLARCREAVKVLDEVRAAQAAALPGRLRTGTVLPLSASALALLLLW